MKTEDLMHDESAQDNLLDRLADDLGHVREVHPHYLLVGREGEHADVEVPVHAILSFADGQLQVSVNRDSVTEVDDVETAHRMGQE